MKVKIAIFFIFVYCITLLVNLPAAVVVAWMPKTAIKINDVTGSIWQGQAKQVVVNPKLTLQNVKWDIQFDALLDSVLAANVSFDNGPQSMSGKAVVEYGITSGQASASNVILDLTSQELLTFLPMQLPVKITGEFSAAIKKVQQGSPYCEQLDGVIFWNNAYLSSQMGNIDLSSAAVDLSCDNGNISALVTQKSEQLITNLDVKLSEGGAYQLNGDIQGTDKLDPSIAQSLSWAGPRNASGATTINFKGRL
ncbi:type II secretion system protein N [Psychromonas sp. RZ22]|uniref:type II secretion system protein N n=1 Tax=Psychromonas algarum TaxID=2555643 RepID=UPI0010673144|nr:type II secretion system protein N [Psychromonas sp. RZ22]TEW53937.1 type II secretion system protein N [Psychromonas sp. RZ22]